MSVRKIVGFEISLSARNDGTLEAAYIRLKEGKVAYTEEIIEDVLLVDYNSRRDILGIEILSTVKLSDLVHLVDQSRRRPFRKFVKQSLPQELVVA